VLAATDESQPATAEAALPVPGWLPFAAHNASARNDDHRQTWHFQVPRSVPPQAASPVGNAQLPSYYSRLPSPSFRVRIAAYRSATQHQAADLSTRSRARSSMTSVLAIGGRIRVSESRGCCKHGTHTSTWLRDLIMPSLHNRIQPGPPHLLTSKQEQQVAASRASSMVLVSTQPPPCR
jgi:hypothetical protein